MLSRRAVVRSIVVACVLPGTGLGDEGPQSLPTIELFHSPSCGCCKNWLRYMEVNGFPVHINLVKDIKETVRDFGIPDNLAGCHVAQVSRYLVGGHVPAEEIRKLLAEQPPWKGIFVPGMPKGAPGLEGRGQAAYRVFALGQDGSQQEIATYRPAADE